MYLTKLLPAVFAVLALGCTPRAKPLAADHPANLDAEAGRLVGPPSALLAGTAQLDEPVPQPRSTSSHDHGNPAAELPGPSKPTPKKPTPRKPAPAKPVPHPPGHEGHN